MTDDGRKFSVDELKQKIADYIERCTGEKLTEKDWVGKDVIEVNREHMIAMTIYGICSYIEISDSTWKEWRKDEKYSPVIRRAEMKFKAYNIEGAAAGLLNPNIIARIEGLAENQVQTQKVIEVTIGDSDDES